MTNQIPDPVEFTLRWSRIPSVSGNEEEVLAVVEDDLREYGWAVERIPVDTSRYNLLAGKRTGSVLLTSHLDTVPPFIEPSIHDEILSGRGVLDAKGQAAAMFCAATAMRSSIPDVSLLFVVGEETISDGAKAAAKTGLKFSYLINGEPTENRCAVAQKGNLRVELTCSGHPCHSGYPEAGRSAVHTLVMLLHRVLSHSWPHDPILGSTTVNIGRISGGVADNVLADSASARLMFRLTESHADILRILEQLVGDDASLRIDKGVDPITLHCPSGYPETVVSFGSDVPHLQEIGTPIMIGPGSILRAHGDNEHITIRELREAVDIYRNLITHLSGRTE